MLLRKSLVEFYMQLDEKEMSTALNMENSAKIVEMLFNFLSDEDLQIKKAALQIIASLFSKPSPSKPLQTLLDQHLAKSKLLLYKLCFPQPKHSDPSLMVKSLQVIQRILSI